MRTDTKLDTLRRIPLFAGCSTRELREISKVADEVLLPAGYTLTREGATGKELVVIVEGAADVVRHGRTIDAVGDGDVVGEIAVVTDAPRTATVKTTRPTRALVFTRRDVRALMRRRPTIGFRVLDVLAARLPALD